MIHKLRLRHRQIFPPLAVLTGVLFTLGVANRRAVPEIETLPPVLEWQQSFTATGEERNDLFEPLSIRVRLWREQSTRSLAIDFKASQDFLRPDLLVYWTATPPQSATAVPPSARLVGAFIGGPLILPEESSSTDGFLILFSAANQEVVATSRSARFNAPAK